MQNRAIRLMASKLAVAGIIEGNFTDEELAAMSDCSDMTTALARELTQGIKNEVEDLSAVFKKMAVLKPVEEVEEVVIVEPKQPVAIIDDTVLTYVNCTAPIRMIAETDISLNKIYEELSAA